MRKWVCWAVSGLNENKGLITTVATVLLVVATVLLVIATWYLAHIADKSDTTLKDTLKANISAERAFIYIQPTGIDRNTDSGGERRWVFRAQIGNSGTTSTREMTYAFDCTEDAVNLFDEARLKANEVTGYAIGPKAVDNTIEACLKTDSEMNDFIAKKRHLYIVGRATYRDVFQNPSDKKTRVTEVCVEMFEFSRSVHPLPQYNGAIDARARHCRQGHNCNDEECERKGN